MTDGTTLRCSVSVEGTDVEEAQTSASVPCGHTLIRGWLAGFKDIEWYDPHCRIAYLAISKGTWQAVRLDEQ